MWAAVWWYGQGEGGGTPCTRWLMLELGLDLFTARWETSSSLITALAVIQEFM